jgi:hypothetical protein
MLQNIIKSQHCCLIELKHIPVYSNEVKAIIAGGLNNLCSALALIVTPGAMKSNAVGFLKDYPNKIIPVKFFSNERAARFWLGRKLLETKEAAAVR